MDCSLLLLALLLGGPEGLQRREDTAVELRALQGYLGLYTQSLALTALPRGGGIGRIGVDLRARLESFLDRPDLPPAARREAIRIYRGLARAMARAGRSEQGPGEPGGERRMAREVYAELARRAEAAGLDTVPLELEMLSSTELSLDAQEMYRRIAAMIPLLQGRTGSLEPEDLETLRGVLRRLLREPAWPDLQGGEALTGTIQLLLKLRQEGRSPYRPEIAGKLADWTTRLLRAEAARESDLAMETAIIHLYNSLEISSGELDSTQREAALKGLEALLPPGLAQGGPVGEERLRTVEIGEVRLYSGQQIPRLPPAVSPEASHLLVPRKSYQVELICAPEGSGPKLYFRVLARAGVESRIVLPRSIPAGMVPITAAETGRVAFLADKKPWSIRRFLLAFQRCGNTLANDQPAVLRIYRSTALQTVPLGGGLEPSFSALVELLSSAQARERLEEIFWVDGQDGAGQAAAFEIAGTILSGNTGLRDSSLVLPTVSEANRLWRDGERFALDAPRYGLFNATRLVPEPKELGDQRRYVIRAVIPLTSP